GTGHLRSAAGTVTASAGAGDPAGAGRDRNWASSPPPGAGRTPGGGGHGPCGGARAATRAAGPAVSRSRPGAAGRPRPPRSPRRAGRVREADEAVELTAGGVGDRRGQGEYPRRALDLVTGVTTGAARYGHGRLLPGVAQDDDQGGQADLLVPLQAQDPVMLRR